MKSSFDGFYKCVCVGVFLCFAVISEDLHMTTHQHTEDSTPSEDLYMRPRKTLSKNAENVMFYHLTGSQRSENFNGLHILLYI